VLLFTYAFGGAIHPPSVDRCIDYRLPGLVVLAIAFGASQTGVAIAEDLTSGMIDRFRALPMTRSAVLAGRGLADAVRNLFVLAVMTGLPPRLASVSTPDQQPPSPPPVLPSPSGSRSPGSTPCSDCSSATPNPPA
jgi:hypothetical protein